MARTAVLLAVALLFAQTPATQSQDAALRPDCLGHVDYIDHGLSWVMARSDVIAHIRMPVGDIPAACPPSRSLNHCACALHDATVVRVLKGTVGKSHVLRLIQDGAGVRGQESPYGAGGEFIAFLTLDVSASAFNRVSGPHYMFPVRNGRVDLAGRSLPGFTDGMTVEEFQKAIEAMPPSGNSGRIIGIAADSSGAPMPGTTITLRWAASERTVITDTRGAFSFYDVPPGQYAVVASLQGFDSVPHTDVAVSPGGSATLVFELTTDCMRLEDGAADGGLGWAARESDLIAHIRIPALVPPSACSIASHCSCTLHHASALRVIRGQPVRELRLIQEGVGYATGESSYVPGDEFIAFLKRDDKNFAYRRLVGAAYMFRVRNGRVDLSGRKLPGFVDGMTVAEFIKALEGMRP